MSRRNRIDGYRVSTVLHEPEIRDDGKEGGLAAFLDARMGRESLKRGLRKRVAGRAEEGQHDHAAGKRIEGKTMAPPIEEKGAVARLSAGLERKIIWLAHRTFGRSAC